VSAIRNNIQSGRHQIKEGDRFPAAFFYSCSFVILRSAAAKNLLPVTSAASKKIAKFADFAQGVAKVLTDSWT